MKKEAHTNGRAKSHFSGTLRKLGALSSLRQCKKKLQWRKPRHRVNFFGKRQDAIPPGVSGPHTLVLLNCFVMLWSARRTLQHPCLVGNPLQFATVNPAWDKNKPTVHNWRHTTSRAMTEAHDGADLAGAAPTHAEDQHMAFQASSDLRATLDNW